MPPKKASSDGSKSAKKQKLDNDGSDAPTGKTLTKEEEEALSSAAIAQLLAQEGGDDQNGYYAEYNNNANYDQLGGDYSDDDDDYRYDYNYKPKSRSRRAGACLFVFKPSFFLVAMNVWRFCSQHLDADFFF